MGKHAAQQCVLFQGLFDRPAHIFFNQERSSSDGGAVLIAGAEKKLGLLAALANCIGNQRAAGKVVHGVATMLRQRVFGLLCGYADCNDVVRLKHDPLFPILAGGEDGGAALASQSTLSRLENSVRRQDLLRIGYAIAETVLRSVQRARRRRIRWINLDMDPTVDPAHGEQQLTFFNGFHRTRCYKPMTVFMQLQGDPEQYLLAAALRAGNASDFAGACALLRRVIPLLRKAFPRAQIRVRLDGGFACEPVLACLETWKFVKYAVNLPKNSVVQKKGETTMRRTRRLFRKNQVSTRQYGEFRYAARKWSRRRRVIVKAEIVTHPGREPRENPRFLVTNMKGSARAVYENFYCGRGDAENRIKELKDSLAFDRTSCQRFLANQFRVLLAVAAFALLQYIRKRAVRAAFARAQAGQILLELFKLGARVTVSVRRIVIELPASPPARRDWENLARSLGAA